MNTDEARQSRMRTEARNAALAANRVERISNLGIGRADSQRVSIDAVGTAVAELEREIDRLQSRIAEIEQYNGEKDERVRELGNCNTDLNRLIDRLEHRLENQARTIKVQEATIARLTNAAHNPPICPKEPPLPTEAANAPREAVGVHPAPNVTIAESTKK